MCGTKYHTRQSTASHCGGGHLLDLVRATSRNLMSYGSYASSPVILLHVINNIVIV